jgi:poly(3-hydroxybutyrate) depolymerase
MKTISTIISLSAVLATVVVAVNDFEKRDVTIWSDGVRMAGDLYLPKGLKPDEKLPAVLFCAGTSGTKKGTPQKTRMRFVQAGCVCLAFDYRGWGESDSRLMSLDKQPAPAAGACWLEEPKVARPLSLCYLTGTADPLNILEGGAPKLAFGGSDKVRA